MGEYAEMMINGDSCQVCGEFLGEGPGHPMTCSYCHSEIMKLEIESEQK